MPALYDKLDKTAEKNSVGKKTGEQRQKEREGWKMRLRKKEALTGIILVLPFLAGFLLFYLVPFVISIWYSFTSGVGGLEFVGLQNYLEVMKSHAFRLAAGNTFRFIGMGIPLIMCISLVLSLLVYQRAGKSGLFQSVFLYPMVIPVGTTVLFFQVMLSEYGAVNRILSLLHLPAQQWLNCGKAFYVLLFLYIWKNCGYNMVIFLTGLNAVPAEFWEAASLEGAGAWRYFWHIQSPLLVPDYMFVFVMSVINSFKCYREAYLLAGNYPHDSIYMLQHFMNHNFENLNYQRLSVAAILIFLVISLLVIILFACRPVNTQKNRKRIRQGG